VLVEEIGREEAVGGGRCGHCVEVAGGSGVAARVGCGGCGRGREKELVVVALVAVVAEEGGESSGSGRLVAVVLVAIVVRDTQLQLVGVKTNYSYV